MVVLSPYAGVVADRFDKRRLLQLTQLAMGLTSLALGALAVSRSAGVDEVYVLAVCFGVATVFDAPARQALVPELVEVGDLVSAVGLTSAVFNAARLVGPALAGVAIAALGGDDRAAGWVIVAGAAAYGAAAALLARIRVPRVAMAQRAGKPDPGLRAALTFIRTSPRMVTVLIMMAMPGTFALNFQVSSGLMATQVFGRGAGEFGVLSSALAVGSVGGALISARRRRVRLRSVAAAGVAFGAAEVAAGLMPTYLAFALACPLIGLSTLAFVNSANATMQLCAPAHLRGRVMAVYLVVAMGGPPVGAPLMGWVGQHLGARWTLIGSGLLTIGGVATGVAYWLGRAVESRFGPGEHHE